ncbi:MAG: HAD family phosphatase [Oscillospiraceae bacterium]|nr:HAD family phosphatase [Oscillospiraceae bacterium]
MIKLIATDLDNTLLDKSGQVPQSTLDIIARAEALGTRVAIVTGRSYASASGIASLLGENTPVICYNGSVIMDTRAGKPMFAEYLDWELVKGILDFAKENDLYVQLYDHDVIVVEKLRLDRHPDPDLRFASYREIGSFEGIEPFNTPKMLLATVPALVPELQSRLEELYGDRAYFAQSESHLIEVMPKGCHKGVALGKLTQSLGFGMENVMGCGDNTNDIPLLEASGLSVAVANAVQELKDIADYVCENERSEGFNEAVVKFVLEREEVKDV